jgi:hypothetical protein
MRVEQRDAMRLLAEVEGEKARKVTDRAILREYAAIDRDPVYAAPGLLVSPSLVRLLRGVLPVEIRRS